jgi:exodeoxyribonuclease V beta subunit
MAFDLCGPLPTGTTVLEASAGTGKTFAIAALATRYVAEGVTELSGLMMVTFGRAATQELRERVRERFVSAERALRDPGAARADSADEVVRRLAATDDAEVERRRHRLARALAGFDGAMIATTHGFCQQVLLGLGILGDSEPGVTFVENITDLVTEVVDDLYLAKYARPDAGVPAMSPRVAHQVVRAAVDKPQTVLAPADAERATAAGQRVALAGAARTEVVRRKRLGRLVDYDDQIGLLRDALERLPAAGARIRERYQVVLVDEFQDTDETQWEVLRLAFHGAVTLVLVGDPKQAIYAFRGGDVQTYLAAAAAATAHEELDRNWRSDPPLLEALDRIYGGAALGDPRIVVRPVVAGRTGSRLAGAPPLRLRQLRRPAGSTKMPAVADVRGRVATDVATDIVGLLTGATLLSGRAVRPADVAVLVRTNDQGGLVRDALAVVGVPVVLAGATSVFSTPGARAWLVLLQAIEAPRALLARAAALTPLLGWTVADLDARGDEGLDELGDLLRGWGIVLATRGVAALFEVVSVRTDLIPRLLAATGGERTLTDLRHVAHELHRAAVTEGLGLTALVEWLQRRRAETGIEGAAERSRRLESDAEAVQIRTVHTSKGLEWPIVYVPFGWDRWQPSAPDPLLLHDDAGHRVLDVGGETGPGYDDRRLRHLAEDSGEDLRLLYVALTRAQSQVVLWWAPSTNTPGSALNRLLLGDRGFDGGPPSSVPVRADSTVSALLASYASPLLAVEEVVARPASWAPPAAPVRPLSAAAFERTLDLGWSRTSYSGLTAAAHDGPGGAAPAPAGFGSEPEEGELADEPVPQQMDSQPEFAVNETAALRSPMAELPAGTAFGTLVHEIVEVVDTAATDLRAELELRCAEAVGGRTSWVAPDTLAAALVTVFENPLRIPGQAGAGEFRLRDVPPADRLVELTFELPLAGGDHAREGTTLRAIADLLRGHLPADDPLAGYPDLLAGLEPQALRGYLTGSIDALLRIDRGASGPTHLVVDYKTNRLGDDLADYTPDKLAAAMLGAHYPLQALLYSVAAHRFLRWRLPDYDIDAHLGGVLYLFVRGMAGPRADTGTDTGVFAWRPSSALVGALSDLLA